MSKEEQLKLNPRSASLEQIIAQAILEYKEILEQDNVLLSDKDASEQAIGLLNLFGALTANGKEREDEA